MLYRNKIVEMLRVIHQMQDEANCNEEKEYISHVHDAISRLSDNLGELRYKKFIKKINLSEYTRLKELDSEFIIDGFPDCDLSFKVSRSDNLNYYVTVWIDLNDDRHYTVEIDRFGIEVEKQERGPDRKHIAREIISEDNMADRLFELVEENFFKLFESD